MQAPQAEISQEKYKVDFELLRDPKTEECIKADRIIEGIKFFNANFECIVCG